MYQLITIVGRLGRDPEMKLLASGQQLASFSVATDRSVGQAGGARQKETTWFRVSVFGKQAEVVNQYLSKGRMVVVEGRLGVDPATGGPRVFIAKDGTAKAAYEIIANDVRFLPTGGDDAAGAADRPAAFAVTPRSNDDLPF
jgi:single-strand DNA-binding protein